MKLVTLAQAVAAREAARSQGRLVAVANGAFDLLHVGHARYLLGAKEAAAGGLLIVGVDGEDPVAARLGPRELVLPGEIVEGPLHHAGAQPRGHLARPVARPAVDHQHLVAEPERLDAPADALRLVLRQHGGGEAQGHECSRMRAIRSLVEWSLGSPTITVRPPSRATSSRSGTEPAV